MVGQLGDVDFCVGSQTGCDIENKSHEALLICMLNDVLQSESWVGPTKEPYKVFLVALVSVFFMGGEICLHILLMLLF